MQLLFPHPCYGCGKKLLGSASILCVACESSLKPTPFHTSATNNYITQKFMGRANIASGAALFLFSKTGLVQHIVHQLKYNNAPEVGIYLGAMYGQLLKEHTIYNSVDIIVPVPLHPSKQKKRGYNQSEQFAIGISQMLKAPVLNDGLQRFHLTDSQTRKKRLARWKNVCGEFYTQQETALSHKHILLVDDVLTTGATLDSCVSVLNLIPHTKVSIATIAVVMK